MTAVQAVADRSRLAHDDAYFGRPYASGHDGAQGIAAHPAALRHLVGRRTLEQGRSSRSRSRSKRRKVIWKKLLWVKQSYPDNYTDQETFLDALQRNPRLQPYEFWPLVADATVIVQQLCTTILFLCCFSGIYRERVSASTVVGCGTIGTVLGWLLWDSWVGQEHVRNGSPAGSKNSSKNGNHTGTGTDGDRRLSGMTNREAVTANPSTDPRSLSPERQNVALESSSERSGLSSSPLKDSRLDRQRDEIERRSYDTAHSRLSGRTRQRLATAKSAILIYLALLGLSPILKSLTKSTSSDSIWAIGFWLMSINVLFFDYGSGISSTAITSSDGSGGGSNMFRASLSTNAGLMASTVLASRLQSPAQVFSLTLFSIEVFGLFPVFRRYLKHFSWNGHVLLTLGLILGASAGVGVCTSQGGWGAALAGIVLGYLITGLAMGVCSWWLIGLQRYKNEIHGPWDPARPVVRRSD